MFKRPQGRRIHAALQIFAAGRYDVVKKCVAEGYDAVKIDPVFAPTVKGDADLYEILMHEGTHHRWSYSPPDLRIAVERIAAAREAGGPDLGHHRTENCVQKMSLRGKIKT